jgi:hypothetical protein
MTILLLAYAVLFPLLTADTLSKLLPRLAAFETANALLLLYLEFGRLLTSGIAIILAAVMLARKRADSRALAVALLFAVIAYEKKFGSNGFPGPVQESVANALLSRGVSPKILAWLFGPLAWAVWPSLAAMLRFSVVFPREMDESTLLASGQQDRRGFMRNNGLAGRDIGAAFRGMSLALLQRRLYEPRMLAAGALILVVAHTVLQPPLAVTLILGAFIMCIVITNLRAAYLVSVGEDRARATWIAQAPLVAGFIFLGSALLLAIAPAMRTIAFTMIMAAPIAAICCLALSVLDRGELNTQNALGRTVALGSAGIGAILLFGAVYAVAPVWVALIIALVSIPVVKRVTDRVSKKILET